MNATIRCAAAAILALSLGRTATGADASAPDTVSQDELLTKIRELEAKVAQLEANSKANGASDQVLQDATQRSKAQALGTDSAGWDNGFYLRSADGEFTLKPGLMLQVRNVTNFREDSKNLGNDDVQNGFEITRAKFVLEGAAFTDIGYKFQWASNRSGGGFTLEDAFLTYKFSPKWMLKAGQFKDPVHHEELTGDLFQLAADRSLVNQLLGGGALGQRVQGVALAYTDPNDKFRAEVAFHDGANSLNTNFQDTAAAHWGAAGRVEYKAFGKWSDYKDFSAINNKQDLLVLGAGADLTEGNDVMTMRATIDAQYEMNGRLGLYGALFANRAWSNNDDGEDRFDFGALAQAGYAINNQWEVFGRYSGVSYDSDFVADPDVFSEFTVGVNYFLGKNGAMGHRAAITVDLNYLPEGVPTDLTGLGYLASPDEESIVLRAQFNLIL